MHQHSLHLASKTTNIAKMCFLQSKLTDALYPCYNMPDSDYAHSKSANSHSNSAFHKVLSHWQNLCKAFTSERQTKSTKSKVKAVHEPAQPSIALSFIKFSPHTDLDKTLKLEQAKFTRLSAKQLINIFQNGSVQHVDQWDIEEIPEWERLLSSKQNALILYQPLHNIQVQVCNFPIKLNIKLPFELQMIIDFNSKLYFVSCIHANDNLRATCLYTAKANISFACRPQPKFHSLYFFILIISFMLHLPLAYE